MSRCHIGDCREVLAQLAGDGTKVQMCVTSPPYWGLRDYGHAGQLGLEATPQEYVENMVGVFRAVRDVLADDGTLWLNLGDSYNNRTKVRSTSHQPSLNDFEDDNWAERASRGGVRMSGGMPGIKEKDLVGIPWRVAFALQADGWYLRQDIIWAKPNPMPESVRDRCTKSHEYLFLLSKNERYYFDAEAIQEPFTESSIARLEQPNIERQAGSDRVPGKTNGPMKACGPSSYRGSSFTKGKTAAVKPTVGQGERIEASGRNKRSVWTVSTQPYDGAHFATFPPALIEPCILAGSRPGDVVLDPFFGSGTTGQVCERLGRQWIGIELNPAYEELQRERTAQRGLVLA